MDSIDRIKGDKELRHLWQANIAMCMYDAYYSYKKKNKKSSMSSQDVLKAATQGADDFLALLLDEIKTPKGR